MTQTKFRQPIFKERLIMIVGNFGSGKTEVAVNLAFYFQAEGHKVAIADLDVVNLYFRCREQLEAMEAEGIRVVVPKGGNRFADLPVVLPEIKGMIQSDGEAAGIRIFDVGGDDVGAILLSSLREALGERPYSLLQVVNANRPFTDSVTGIIAMKDAIERKSRMRVTGFISNSHLMADTTPEVILKGLDIAKEAARLSGLEVELAAILSDWKAAPELQGLDVPVLFMERRMLPPWKTGRTVLEGDLKRPVFGGLGR